MAITVLPGTLLFIQDIGQLPFYLLVLAVSFAVGFTLTWFFGYSDKMAEEPKESKMIIFK